MNVSQVSQQISFSDELTVTPSLTVTHFENSPNTSNGLSYFQQQQKQQQLNSSQDASFGSSSFDFGSPVDLSSGASPMTSHSPFNKDDGPTVMSEKVGENASIRDLIMSAIGVMKSRKARPDSKRISSWIHRRYNRPILAVTEELERLVTVGELARVDYKGSASFRITSLSAKMRRKRKNNKPLGRAPSNNPIALGGVLPPMFCPSPDGSGPQLTLHQLVIERLAESTQHTSFEQGLTIPTQYIAKAVEDTSREFSRAAILGNLDLILEREVSMGLFQKIDNDTYRLIPPNKPQMMMAPLPPISMANNVYIKEEILATNGMTIYPPNICQQMMAPQPPPQTGQPVAQLSYSDRPPFVPTSSEMPFTSESSFPPGIMSMSPPPPSSPSSLQQVSQSLLKGCTFTMPSGPNTSYPGGPPCAPTRGLPNSPPSLLVTQTSIDKSDDQMKDDLIRSQLSKISTKDPKGKSPYKRTNSMSEDTFRRKGESHQQSYNQQQQRPMGSSKKGPILGGDCSEDSNTENGGYPNDCKRRFEGSFDPEIKIKTLESSNNDEDPNSRSMSGRKKKSRKIFDPADQDLSFRRRKTSLTPPPSPNSNTGSSAYWSHEVDSNDESKQSYAMTPANDICVQCNAGLPKFPKCATEVLLRCKDCPLRVHPGCLKYSEAKAQKVLSVPWQCINCKTCTVCQRTNNEGLMLFCGSCDQGFHLSCHNPPLSFKPAAHWDCFRCQTQQGNNSFKNGGMINGHRLPCITSVTLQVEEKNRFPPIAGPFSSPHTGVLPTAWQNFESDLNSPDISAWLPHQISNYFAQHGFGNDICKVFVEQELDGRSLLLMQRSDVVTGLGLRLGPALKVYSHVKRFQLCQQCNNKNNF